MAARRRRNGRTILLHSASWAAIAMAAPQLAFAAPHAAPALPRGGSVVSGQATIASSGANALTISQSSKAAIVNWASFSIGQGGAVQFDNGSGATLNRVLSGGPVSSIDGRLSATGSVYLINPSGVIIGKSGVVQVGGTFAASTLDVDNAAFLSGGALTFSGASQASVVNLGKVEALGGDVVMAAAVVRNQGTITAPNGDVGLLAGYTVTMTDQADNDGLFVVQLGGTGTSVTNEGVIAAATAELRANGGNVYALAGNTASIIKATDVTNQGGQIFLTAPGGSVTVAKGATLDASGVGSGDGGHILVDSASTSFQGTALAEGGPLGGNGGLVETSGGTLNFAGAKVDTSAPDGRTGTWLLDPWDLTVDATGAQAIENGLADNNVVVQTTSSSPDSAYGTTNSSGAGDITVAAPITWSSGDTLTFDAYHSLHIDAPITVEGAGGVVIETDDGGTGGDYDFGLTGTGFSGSLSFTGGSASGATLDINGTAYTLLYSMSDVQNINDNLGGDYALAASLDASSFTPLGSKSHIFTGVFTGFGHTISNLSINLPSDDYVGLFGYVSGQVRDIGLVGGSVAGGDDVGDLVGYASGGSIRDAYATGSVSGGYFVGGLVGYDRSGVSISNVYATGAVSGSGEVGGLVGGNYGGQIDNAYATGAVRASGGYVGGLVGYSDGSITDAYATGAVSGSGGYVGGLVGGNDGSITDAYATGAVSGSGANIGGLVGYNNGVGTVINGWYDTQTTGQTTDGNGATGLTTAQLQGLAPISGSTYFSLATNLGDNGSTWGGGANGLYPYLKAFFPNGVQAVSGVAYTNAGTTVAASGANGAVTVNLDAGGGLVGQATTGANGYYYIALPAGTVANGGDFLVSTPANNVTGAANAATLGTSTYASGTPAQSDVNLYGGFLSTPTGATTLSTAPNLASLQTVADTAAGTDATATGVISAITSPGYLAAGAFTIDQSYDGAGLLVSTPTGDALTVSSPVETTGGNLGLLSGGALNIDAPIMAEGAASVALAYNSSSATNLSFGLAGAGFGGSLSFANADGSAATSSQGGALTINGASYTLLYSMSDVQNINNGLGGDYALAGSLDASGSPYSEALVGGPSSTFTGAFEGLGHTISNLMIDDTSGSGDDGLFGQSSGTIRDIGIVGGSVTGGSYVGGLAGYQAGGSIADAYATEAVSGSGNFVGGLVGQQGGGSIADAYAMGAVSGRFEVGGLVGYQSDAITDAYATGAVSGSANVGGLIGYQGSGAIIDAYATGAVSGSGGNVGGLVGNQSEGSITDAYATGAVSGSSTVGGLAGYQSGAITDAYATGAVRGSSQVGGLVGYDYASSITDAYATGAVSGASEVGGLVGYNGGNGGTFTNDYYDIQTTGQTTDGAGAMGLTTAQLQGLAPISGSTYFSLATNLGDNGSTWGGGANGLYPYLQAFFPNGAQAVSGFAYQDAGTTPAASGANGAVTVNLDAGGSLLAQATAGANGYYYVLLPAGTVAKGSNFLVSTPANSSTGAANAATLAASTYASGTPAQSEVNLYGGFLSTPTSAPTLETVPSLASLQSAADTAAGNDTAATGVISSIRGAGYLATGPFTVEHNFGSGLLVTTPSGDRLSVGPGTISGSLTLIGGALVIDGSITADGSVDMSTPTSLLITSEGSITAGSGDDITLAAGAFTNEKGASALSVSGGGRWLIYTSAPGADTFFDLDSDNTAVWDTAAGASVTASGNRYVFAYQPTLTITTTDDSKTYGVDATSQIQSDYTVTGLEAAVTGAYLADTVSTAVTAAPTIASSGEGVSASVDGGPYAITASGGSFESGYALQFANTGELTVSPATLSASIIGTPSKTYDGSTDAALTSANYQITGLVGSQDLTITQTAGSYNSADVADATTVTAALTSGDFSGSNGFVASNYTLPTTASGSGQITPATLSASIIGAPSKTYDGTTDATLTSANYQLTGLVGSEQASVTQTSGSYNSADVADATTVTASLASGDFSGSGGFLASNYTLPTSASGAGQITPATLSASIIGDPSKTYDGSTAATLTSSNYQLTGLVGSEAASVTQTSGSYNSADVVSAATVTASVASGDFSGSGGFLASNYTLPTSASGSGQITPATLLASIIGTPSKTYDGSTDATLTSSNYQLTGLVGSEEASVIQTASSYNSADVASATTVTAALSSSDFSGSNGFIASNYTLPTSASGAGQITPATLSASIIGTPSKTYDGTTDATLTSANYQLTGLVGSEQASVTQTSGSYNSADVVSAATVTASLASGDFSGSNGFIASNYTLPTSASGAGQITPATLSASIIGDPSKTYDGTADAALTSSNYQLTGLVGSEAATITQSSGSYNSADVASATTVTAALTSGDFSGSNGFVASNYTLPTTASGSGQITPATLSASIIGAPSKTYDGTTDATLTSANYQLTGLVGSEAASVTQTAGSYNSADVADATTVTASLASGDFSGSGGFVASNYTLPTSASGSGQITPATLSASIIGDPSKTYDGSTDATLTSANYQLTGLVGSEAATTTQSSGSYNSADVASATTVTAALSSGDFSGSNGFVASNYTLPTTASGAGQITAKTLTASIIGAPTKTYDGTTDATLTSSNYQLTGLVGSEAASVTQTSGSYNSADVVSAATVTASLASGDFSGSNGFLASNYTLPTSASGAGQITPATLSASIIGAPTKTYDGTADATLTSANYQLTGLVGSEAASVTQSSGSYNSADVASAATVTASLASGDFSGSGGFLASNYTLPTSASGAGQITPATLSASIIGAPTKTYDGTTDATLTSSNYQLTGLVGSEAASVTQTAGSYNSADVVSAATVTAALTSGDFSGSNGFVASNYTLPTTASGSGQITPATLSASIIGDPSKTYDGTADATLTSSNYQLTGLVGSEAATVTQSAGSYNSADVASAATVTASLANGDFSGSNGFLASNYTLPTTASGAGQITAEALTVAANDESKITGHADPALDYTVTVGSLAAGDGLTGSLVRAPGDTPGSYPIDQGSLQASNNYTMTFEPGVFTILAPVLAQQPLPAANGASANFENGATGGSNGDFGSFSDSGSGSTGGPSSNSGPNSGNANNANNANGPSGGGSAGAAGAGPTTSTDGEGQGGPTNTPYPDNRSYSGDIRFGGASSQ